MHVGRSLALSCAAALIAAATAGAAIPIKPIPIGPGGGTATAELSSAAAAARPVKLTLRARYEMVCGRPGPGSVVVTLPATATVPQTIGTATVLVNGRRAPAVSVDGHTITVQLARRTGILCDVVGPGTLQLVFTPAAGLGNPASAGPYPVTIQRGRLTFHVSLEITA